MINSTFLKEKHKKSPKSFVRNRKLTFPILLLFMLRKSTKSLQNSLNELFNKIDENLTVATGSAFSQARHNISHEIFIEINKTAIIDTVYLETKEFKSYKGFRLLSFDGSKFLLPDSEDIKKEFGEIRNQNQNGELSNYSGALVSVLYDLENELAIDSKIVPANTYEVDLALEQLSSCQENDLIIADRGYASYKFLAILLENNIDFVIRIKKNSFKEAKDLFSGNIDSKIVKLKKPKSITSPEIASEITVRFVQVILDTGEVEVLVTSLLDEEIHPTSEFKKLYWKRWGIETFYDIIKNRLNVENFTGKSVEAIKQDFFATILISNYESIIIQDAQEELEKRKKKNKNELKVNKAVSFNTIKNHVIGLFYSESDIEKLIEKMTKLFLKNPYAIRENRSFERNSSARKGLNFRKRRYKNVF